MKLINKSFKITIKLFLLIAILLSSACSARKTIPVGTIPAAQQPSSNAVERSFKALKSKTSQEGDKLTQTGKEYKRCKEILDRLSVAAGVSKGTWPLYIVDGWNKVNAAAVNQSTIIVYTGLINKVRNDAELATVLAHEVSHIIAKHGNDKGKKSKSMFTGVVGGLLGQAAAIGASAAGYGSLSSTAGTLTQQATQVVGTGLILSYDRSQEHEADHVGLMLMAKAGYDPRTAIDFWARAGEVFESGGIGISFLSTHPSEGNRAKRLEAALPKALEYYGKK